VLATKPAPDKLKQFTFVSSSTTSQYYKPLTRVRIRVKVFGVANVFASCPADPEEAADAYLLSRMSPSEAEEFKQHLARCFRCRQLVETARAFIQALRDAAHDSAKTRAAASN
jgi:hypothetical protein